MILLAGSLDVMLRGISLVAFATAVGGIAFVLWALRALQFVGWAEEKPGPGIGPAWRAKDATKPIVRD